MAKKEQFQDESSDTEDRNNNEQGNHNVWDEFTRARKEKSHDMCPEQPQPKQQQQQQQPQRDDAKHYVDANEDEHNLLSTKPYRKKRSTAPNSNGNSNSTTSGGTPGDFDPSQAATPLKSNNSRPPTNQGPFAGYHQSQGYGQGQGPAPLMPLPPPQASRGTYGAQPPPPASRRPGQPAKQNPSQVLARDSSNRLSTISEKYDSSGKGYLTQAEQHMRSLDNSGRGYLTNQQVAAVVEQTMEIRDHNWMLRNWVLAMLGAVIILAISNIGTAFAAARLARDTDVNSESGQIYVKDDPSKTIITQGVGYRLTWQVQKLTEQEQENIFGNNVLEIPSFVCVSLEELARIVANLETSKETALVLESDALTANESAFTMQLDRNVQVEDDGGRLVLSSLQGEQLVFHFGSDLCDKKKGIRRSLQERDPELATELRYNMFFRHLNFYRQGGRSSRSSNNNNNTTRTRTRTRTRTTLRKDHHTRRFLNGCFLSSDCPEGKYCNLCTTTCVSCPQGQTIPFLECYCANETDSSSSEILSPVANCYGCESTNSPTTSPTTSLVPTYAPSSTLVPTNASL